MEEVRATLQKVEFMVASVEMRNKERDDRDNRTAATVTAINEKVSGMQAEAAHVRATQDAQGQRLGTVEARMYAAEKEIGLLEQRVGDQQDALRELQEAMREGQERARREEEARVGGQRWAIGLGLSLLALLVTIIGLLLKSGGAVR